MSTHFDRAVFLFQQSRYHHAENELSKALAAAPNHAEAHSLLALCPSSAGFAHLRFISLQIVVHDAAWFIPQRLCVQREETPEIGAGRELLEIFRLYLFKVTRADLGDVSNVPDG